MARYRGVADVLRGRIAAREYREGGPLPSEVLLAREFGVGRMVVRRALGVLREEGIVATQRGRVAWVRARPRRRTVGLGAGDTLVARMPSAEERARLGIERGVPLLEIRHAGGGVELVNAETVAVVVEG